MYSKQVKPTASFTLDKSSVIFFHQLTEIVHLSTGVLTTHSSILSLIAIFANHPHIQEKVQREIDTVIGRNQPRLQDRHEMHYTLAVRILEILSENIIKYIYDEELNS